ncbi:Arc family DNA-binding protein [Methylorubrum thiocyanatum]
MANPVPPFGLRLPPDLKAWVKLEAYSNRSSQNSEIIRAVRERMERSKPTTGESLQAEAPAVGPNDTALQGGPITHGL